MFFRLLVAISIFVFAGCAQSRQIALPPDLGNNPTAVGGERFPSILHVVPLAEFRGGPYGGTSLANVSGSVGGLVGNPSKALFGVMQSGGNSTNCGVVYELVPQSGGTYREIVLHTFSAELDGCVPFAGLTIDRTGSLYGTTVAGGGPQAVGTVFKLTPSAAGYAYKVIHRFCCFGPDGAQPESPLLIDATGALYGTTYSGGLYHCPIYPQHYTCGLVYKLTPSGSDYVESVLYRFTGGRDGANPQAGVIADTDGDLFGTTEYGGDLNITYGVGTAFKLIRAGAGYAERTLHIFGINDDNAARPNALVADGTGALYGTTTYGGASGAGLIFKLTPSGSAYVERTVHAFDGSDGRLPLSPLTIRSGVFYGSTYSGGTGCSGNSGCGVLYSVAPSGASFQVLYRFDGRALGSSPAGPLFLASGSFYGTTLFGGSTGNGAAYRLTP
ncbi:MAG: hypothetical protein JO322_08795 [Candidatus Eremiobacteraeota bacterium]|nr:hypothetical protein [Candidatus Eremiobacteraeota bacterium]